MDNPVIELGKKAYGLLVKVGDVLQHLLLFVFRVHWGLQFFHTGMGKLQNHEKTAQFFTGLGIPLPDLNAWIAGSVECFGGLLLAIGFATRPVGVLLAFTMCVAYLTVEKHLEAVKNIFKDADPFTEATPFLFLTTALFVICFGPGKVSVDYLLGKFVFNKSDEKSE